MPDTSTLQQLFVSPDWDDVFSTVATFTDGTELLSVDVPEGHAKARRALRTATVNAERRRSNPGARIALITGSSGTGKTHLLATTLCEQAADPAREIYPAVLQLTAPVALADYQKWLVDALFRELGARHFPGPEGHSPLRRLADRLLERVSPEDREAFVDFISDLEEDREVQKARNLGERIRQQGLAFMRDAPPSGPFIGALLLAGYGDISAVNYLRHGHCDDRMRMVGVLPADTPSERFALLTSLGLSAELAGGTLVIALDQVENVVQLGSEALFVHAVTQAVRIAEAVCSTAVSLVVLDDAYNAMARASLAESDTDRIEREAPRAVKLTKPEPELVKRVVARRLEILGEQAGFDSLGDLFGMLPPWLIESLLGQTSLRHALREMSRFREEAAEGEWPLGPPQGDEEPSGRPTRDFDKLWADFHDSGPAIELRMLPAQKASLLLWWSETAGIELTHPFSVSGETVRLENPETHVIDIDVCKDGTPVVRRQLAVCHLPNRNQKLRRQVEAFLEWSSGVPFAYRDQGFPRGRRTQVAEVLRQLADSRGAIVDISPSEWNTLKRAQEFHENNASDENYTLWRKERQWLHNLVRPLVTLIQIPVRRPDSPEEPLDADLVVQGAFPVLLGRSSDPGADCDPVVWDPYRKPPNHLNNFSFLVTGDSGAGKTQTIRVLIDAACREGLPVLVFDFKADYGDSDFATPLGLEVVDVRQGLPFNPLVPPPRGASGAQPAEHAYELAGLLRRVFKMGDVQEGRIRRAIQGTYEALGIRPREWIDPDSVTWPTFDRVLDSLREEDGAAAILTRLEPLVDLGLLPTAAMPESFDSLLSRRVVLTLSDVPTPELKAVLAEILIIQIHAHALRGEQPRRLKRLMVFDEAHRVAGSRRLAALGREGRAFGIGLVIGTQYPGDIPDELAGSMATNLFLMNGQAEHRRAVVRQVLGSTTSTAARTLSDELSVLRPLHGLFVNAHYSPTLLPIIPHYQRST